jgi:DNA polymerase-1
MIAVQNWLPESDLEARMIMQVHDELVFEVAEADAKALNDGVVERMAGAAQLNVPLVVDTGVGENWDQAH